MRNNLFVAAIILLGSGPAWSQDAGLHLPLPPPPAALKYSLVPAPNGDRTNLNVSLTYKSGDGAPESVGLPEDCYSAPQLYRSVTQFEGEGGTVVAAGSAADQRVVTPGPDGQVRLRYTLSIDPAVMARYAFAPHIGPGHFHLAGCQWMLRIGDLAQERPYYIDLTTSLPDWNFYSTLSADPSSVELQSSYEGLSYSAFGGSNGAYRQVMIEGRPLSIFTGEGFAMPTAEIETAIAEVVTLQRTRMNDFDFPFYHVVTLPRPRIMAGTAVPTMFVSFTKPEINAVDLYRGLSHEMFHNWLANRVYINPDNDNHLRVRWIHEGVTEQIARRILVDAGLITIDDMAALVNRDLRDAADNPLTSSNMASLIEVDQSGVSNAPLFKLAYTRGSLIALGWETAMRQAGRTDDLLDLIRILHGGAGPNLVRPTEEDFYKAAADFGIDARIDFNKFIINGQTIDVSADALGPDFTLTTVLHPRYDTGFDMEGSFAVGRTVGVREGGPAWNAGLRNGMAIVGAENTGRFSNSWDPAAPLVLLIGTAENSQRYSYAPEGEMISVPKFVRR